MKTIIHVLLSTVGISAVTGIATACPNCYGAPDSPMTAGMNTAILVMLGITGFVLLAIVISFFLLWRRARRLQTQISEQLFVNEQGILQSKKEKGVVEWNIS